MRRRKKRRESGVGGSVRPASSSTLDSRPRLNPVTLVVVFLTSLADRMFARTTDLCRVSAQWAMRVERGNYLVTLTLVTCFPGAS
jgi:hypothetical protein